MLLFFCFQMCYNYFVIIMEKIKKYLKKIYKITQKKEMKILPGNLAFYIVLTIMPIITLVTFVCSKFNVSLGDVFSFIFNFMPEKVEDILVPALNASTPNFSLIVTIIGFVIASNGAHSIILASNELYGFKNRGFFSRHLKAILMTVMLIIIFMITLLGIGFGSTIMNFVLDLEIFSGMSLVILDYLSYLKYPLSFIIIYYIVRSIYSMAPDTRIKSRSVIPGALFTTFGWLIVTTFYSYYANEIANFDLFYGSISNIVVLMMWVWVISYIFVVGIAINAIECETKKEDK